MTRATETKLRELKAALLKIKPRKLEELSAALLGNLLGVPVALARTGFQYGGDAGTAGRQDRFLRLEVKRYANKTRLDARELLGEFEQAIQADEALEAWILVSTRDASEQIERFLFARARSSGVPVVIIDWKDHSKPALAVLCSTAPELVTQFAGEVAGEIAKRLNRPLTQAAGELRRDFLTWVIGYTSISDAAKQHFRRVWRTPEASLASLGQDASGGSEGRPHIVRTSVSDDLDRWWKTARTPAPAIVLGREGTGKTWSVLDWLNTKIEQLPITLLLPASAFCAMRDPTASEVEEIIAHRLRDLTGARDLEFWTRRVQKLLSGSSDETAILLLIDGLNQEPTVDWNNVLRILQDKPFAGRVRLIITARKFYFKETLGELRGISFKPERIPVDQYSDGELDEILRQGDVSAAGWSPELRQMARNPRLLQLITSLSDDALERGPVTVHRLLWEYGRDSLGQRAGRSFSETEWHSWLRKIADRLRSGERIGYDELAMVTSRPDLDARDIRLRLSEIVDGHFFTVDAVRGLELNDSLVFHCLAVALIGRIQEEELLGYNEVEEYLRGWLEPIASLDERGEVLRAAANMLAASGQASGPIADAVVTAWLQSQNMTEEHRTEILQLANQLIEPLLTAVGKSGRYAHASARHAAIAAIRTVGNQRPEAVSAIARYAEGWLHSVRLDRRAGVGQPENGDSPTYLERAVGASAEGHVVVFSSHFSVGEVDADPVITSIPMLLEPFPLAPARNVFVAAAVHLAIRGMCPAWDGLKWICAFNNIDPDEMRDALRNAAREIGAMPVEPHVRASLRERVVALLLWLSGRDDDDLQAARIHPESERYIPYAKYCENPHESWLSLERRHAFQVLSNRKASVHSRISRLGDLWLDPTFTPPAKFVRELRAEFKRFPAQELYASRSYTPLELRFTECMPALARCAPDLLISLIRKRLTTQGGIKSVAYISHLLPTFFLALDKSTAVRIAIGSMPDGMDSAEWTFAKAAVLILKLSHQCAEVQVREILAEELEFTPEDLALSVKPLPPHSVDALIREFAANPQAMSTILSVLAVQDADCLSETAVDRLAEFAFDTSGQVTAQAFETLCRLSPKAFGRVLLERDWCWSDMDDPALSEHGSVALVQAAGNCSFREIAPRISPWLLLWAAREYGGNEDDIRLAVQVVTSIALRRDISLPELEVLVSIDRTAGHRPFTMTMAPMAHSEDSVMATMRRFANPEESRSAFQAAMNVTIERLREVRAQGGSLFLADVRAEDLIHAIKVCPEFVDEWLQGMEDGTREYRTRVHLAEGAFLALCEALLSVRSELGVALWRSLRHTMFVRHQSGGVDELVRMVFRTMPAPAAVSLAEELLNTAENDMQLFDICRCALQVGQRAWLSDIISGDKTSDLPWRNWRAELLEAFISDRSLPVSEAWPDHSSQTNCSYRKQHAAVWENQWACARHWANVYRKARSVREAFAAWVLFVATADRRVESIWSALCPMTGGDREFRKRVNVLINRHQLETAIRKRTERLEQNFLSRKPVGGIGPWASL